jgi:hypothetical protein
MRKIKFAVTGTVAGLRVQHVIRAVDVKEAEEKFARAYPKRTINHLIAVALR